MCAHTLVFKHIWVRVRAWLHACVVALNETIRRCGGPSNRAVGHASAQESTQTCVPGRMQACACALRALCVSVRARVCVCLHVCMCTCSCACVRTCERLCVHACISYLVVQQCPGMHCMSMRKCECTNMQIRKCKYEHANVRVRARACAREYIHV